MKRQLTHEQIAKRDLRKQQFRALWKRVADMPELERIQLATRAGIRNVEGRELSLNNQCLIISQNPVASVVGGFRQWLGQGRCVRKGEHGAMIWVPIGGSKPGPVEATVQPGAAPQTVEDDTHFTIGTVFSIEQTDELPAGKKIDQNENAA